MAKSMKLGGGGRFAAFKKKLEDKGESSYEAGAVAGMAGRKKYGSKKMGDWSKRGKLREAIRKRTHKDD